MALYSAWDWDRNAFRVFQTPEMVSVGDDPKPPRPRLRHPLGAVPDVDAKVLPPGARPVGYSHQARGEIVRMPAKGIGRLGDLAESAGNVLGSVSVAVAIALGIGIWIGYGQRRSR